MPQSFNGKSISTATADAATALDRRSSAAAAQIAGACGIAVMAKASVPGRTKTRLVPPLTPDEAAALNTAFLQDIVDNLLLAGNHAAIAGYAAYAPPGSADFFSRILPPAIGLIGAWLPTLGDCLSYTIGEILVRGHASAVVLNGDTPNLPTALLVETAETLARPGDRAVLGPSTDGGYYLLGLKAAHRRLFAEIAWSTECVAAQTLERAREIKLDVHILPAWYDIDDVGDLRTLRAELSSSVAPERPLSAHAPYRPQRTAALIDRLAADGKLPPPANRADSGEMESRHSNSSLPSPDLIRGSPRQSMQRPPLDNDNPTGDPKRRRASMDARVGPAHDE